MRYCVRFTPRMTVVPDEIKIQFVQPISAFSDLLFSLPPSCSIVIDISSLGRELTNTQLQFFKEFNRARNYKICMPIDSEASGQKKELRERGIRYYFTDVISSWDALRGIINMGVSDVIIGNELAFSIVDISKICKSESVGIRVYPNVAQSNFSGTPDHLKFFIRPEDIELYDNYIDMCEFFGENKEKDEWYYSIYADDKMWYGDLNEMIVDIGVNIDNRMLFPKFTQLRMNCGKACMKRDSCHACYSALSFADLVHSKKAEWT